MKTAIHPAYIEKAKISCACGAVYEVGPTMKEISIELCANCHPMYTGKQKIVDAARRVEKFNEKTSKKAAAVVVDKKEKQAKRSAARKSKETKA